MNRYLYIIDVVATMPPNYTPRRKTFKGCAMTTRKGDAEVLKERSERIIKNAIEQENPGVIITTVAKISIRKNEFTIELKDD